MLIISKVITVSMRRRVDRFNSFNLNVGIAKIAKVKNDRVERIYVLAYVQEE